MFDDTLSTNEIDTTNQASIFKMQKSPVGAIWRSLVIPGWGQIYVENYWKAPLFFGGAATTIYFVITNHNEYAKFRDQADLIEDKESTEYKLLKSKREFYRNNRDLSGLFFLGVYVITAVDAYVGAHLFDFEVDENISLNLAPNYNMGMSLGLSIKL